MEVRGQNGAYFEKVSPRGPHLSLHGLSPHWNHWLPKQEGFTRKIKGQRFIHACSFMSVASHDIIVVAYLHSSGKLCLLIQCYLIRRVKSLLNYE